MDLFYLIVSILGMIASVLWLTRRQWFQPARKRHKVSTVTRDKVKRSANRQRRRPIRPQSPWLKNNSVVQGDLHLNRQLKETIASETLSHLNSLTRDRATSIRLVEQVKDRNPGRDLNWCAEKAIRDLERDRLH